MNNNDKKFLEENFNKRASLRKAMESLNELLLELLKEIAMELIKQPPEIFGKKIKRESNKGKDWIYIQLSLKNKEIFKDFEFGIEYLHEYKCGQFDSFSPYAGAHFNKKTNSEVVLKFFEKNIKSNMETWGDEQGMWIWFKDDWGSGNLKHYAKTLNELSQQLHELCAEVIRLMNKYEHR